MIIFECDGCGLQQRSTYWSSEEGWHSPKEWLHKDGYSVCSNECIHRLNDSLATPTTTPPRPKLEIVP